MGEQTEGPTDKAILGVGLITFYSCFIDGTGGGGGHSFMNFVHKKISFLKGGFPKSGTCK